MTRSLQVNNIFQHVRGTVLQVSCLWTKYGDFCLLGFDVMQYVRKQTSGFTDIVVRPSSLTWVWLQSSLSRPSSKWGQLTVVSTRVIVNSSVSSSFYGFFIIRTWKDGHFTDQDANEPCKSVLSFLCLLSRETCLQFFFFFFIGDRILCVSWPPSWFHSNKFPDVGSLAAIPTPQSGEKQTTIYLARTL
jgi:hypothetical protein